MSEAQGRRRVTEEDPRYLRVRASLVSALFELAAEVPADEISVSQLASAAGVSRTTFYSHSSSPAQLLADTLVDRLDTDLLARAYRFSEKAHAGQTRRNGDLNGKPAIIVHGRSYALLPVNHTSRPYTALNKRVEGRRSQLSYIEVTNAQHFDSFIGQTVLLSGYDTRYVPLHVYLNRGLDAMYDHLRHGRPLPPSQLVRTVPRGGLPGAAPAIVEANVPPIRQQPAGADRITMRGNTLLVPD